MIEHMIGNVFKTFNRPIFENDDEVWNTFAQYASVMVSGVLKSKTGR